MKQATVQKKSSVVERTKENKPSPFSDILTPAEVHHYLQIIFWARTTLHNTEMWFLNVLNVFEIIFKKVEKERL